MTSLNKARAMLKKFYSFTSLINIRLEALAKVDRVYSIKLGIMLGLLTLGCVDVTHCRHGNNIVLSQANEFLFLVVHDCS